MKSKLIHFLYKTTCILTGEYYIGIHSTNDMEHQSTKCYLGSGLRIVRSIAKYGRKNFKREILCFGLTRDYVIELERKYVTRELLQDPLCINLAEGGLGVLQECRNLQHTLLLSSLRRKSDRELLEKKKAGAKPVKSIESWVHGIVNIENDVKRGSNY